MLKLPLKLVLIGEIQLYQWQLNKLSNSCLTRLKELGLKANQLPEGAKKQDCIQQQKDCWELYAKAQTNKSVLENFSLWMKQNPNAETQELKDCFAVIAETMKRTPKGI